MLHETLRSPPSCVRLCVNSVKLLTEVYSTIVFSIIHWIFTWIFSLANLSIDGGHKLQASGCNWVIITKGPLVDLCSLKGEGTRLWLGHLEYYLSFYLVKNLEGQWGQWWNERTLPLYSRARWGLKENGKEHGAIKQVHYHFFLCGGRKCKPENKSSLLKMDDYELSDLVCTFSFYLKTY